MRFPGNETGGLVLLGDAQLIYCLCFEKHLRWKESDNYSSGFTSPQMNAVGTRDPRKKYFLHKVYSVASPHASPQIELF